MYIERMMVVKDNPVEEEAELMPRSTSGLDGYFEVQRYNHIMTDIYKSLGIPSLIDNPIEEDTEEEIIVSTGSFTEKITMIKHNDEWKF